MLFGIGALGYRSSGSIGSHVSWKWLCNESNTSYVIIGFKQLWFRIKYRQVYHKLMEGRLCSVQDRHMKNTSNDQVKIRAL